MKKISLNLIKEHLTRAEMRIISGGSGSSCGFSCDEGEGCRSRQCTCETSTNTCVTV